VVAILAAALLTQTAPALAAALPSAAARADNGAASAWPARASAATGHDRSRPASIARLTTKTACRVPRSRV